MNHRKAVAVMVLTTLLWSTAGVATRHLEAARSFEVTFWRSAFNALALVPLLAWLRGPASLWRSVREGGSTIWISGVCWCVMYTAFMLALTLTTVANVLVTMAIGPLLTALIARVALGHRLGARTWSAIVLAGIGIAWMYSGELAGGDAASALGMAVALAVPAAAAINWVIIQHNRSAGAHDLLPAVLIGAMLSAAITLPMALPFAATPHDVLLLAALGTAQLAIPCVLVVLVARVLSAPEVSLLGLLEVLFGVAWAWWGADEAPSVRVLGGGVLVLAALAGNEALALRERSR